MWADFLHLSLGLFISSIDFFSLVGIGIEKIFSKRVLLQASLPLSFSLQRVACFALNAECVSCAAYDGKCGCSLKKKKKQAREGAVMMAREPRGERESPGMKKKKKKKSRR